MTSSNRLPFDPSHSEVPLPGRRQADHFDRDMLKRSSPIDRGREAWRVLRMQSEFVTAYDTLNELGGAIAVFGSARLGEGTQEYEAARDVGRRLAEAGYAVVTGGGPGTMEGANRGAAEAGGRSVGLGINLPFETGFNAWVDTPVPFHYFFSRKVTFVKYTDGCVVMPGGVGTLDELFEIMTLCQTQKIRSYPIALIGKDFWGPLLEWMEQLLLERGTIGEADVQRPLVTDDIAEAVEFATVHARHLGGAPEDAQD